jgi:hypothetical protein
MLCRVGQLFIHLVGHSIDSAQRYIRHPSLLTGAMTLVQLFVAMHCRLVALHCTEQTKRMHNDVYMYEAMYYESLSDILPH